VFSMPESALGGIVAWFNIAYLRLPRACFLPCTIRKQAGNAILEAP
jgi:hypothetical protein